MTRITVPATYGDSEVRGKMRQWKTELMRKYDIFDRVYDNRYNILIPVIETFVRRSSMVGKQRALKKITKLFGPGVYLEGVRFNPSPLAVFSILRPRGSLAQNATVDTGLMQDCVTVNYILAGSLPGEDVAVAEGYWTLEVPDHAIGRCIHRTGSLPDRIIREAHHNMLRLNTGMFLLADNQIENRKRFNVRAGPGGFSCTFTISKETSSNSYRANVFAGTWITETDHQAFLTGHGHPGARLIDGWLLPAPLLRTEEHDGKVRTYAYDIFLPELTHKH